MAFKKGDKLKQRVQVIEGTVEDVKYDADAGSFQYLIKYPDGEGGFAQRWFDEAHVEKTK